MKLMDARSLLFVPGNRPERFAKAAASGADVVCIDLEDAVPPSEREAARAHVLALLASQTLGHRFGVRVSALTTDDGRRDLQALHAAAPCFAMLSKTESAAQLEALAAQMPGVAQIALIEGAAALLAAAAIADARSPLAALMLGGADLAAELGCEFAWEPLLFARSTIVAAAASRQLASIDVPFLDVADAQGAQAEASRVAALGFSAKAAIHPSQIAPLHAGLAPSAQAVERARRVTQATQTNEGAWLLDGRLVDRPVLLAAERVLRRHAHDNI
jgi:(S)-citramalyl-CoA lyase